MSPGSLFGAGLWAPERSPPPVRQVSRRGRGRRPVGRPSGKVRRPCHSFVLRLQGIREVIYALGGRMGGRAVRLSSALVLCSLGFFADEMRQAGNDGPLVLFTTLALYAAWRCLHDRDDVPLAENQPPPPREHAEASVERFLTPFSHVVIVLKSRV